MTVALGLGRFSVPVVVEATGRRLASRGYIPGKNPREASGFKMTFSLEFLSFNCMITARNPTCPMGRIASGDRASRAERALSDSEAWVISPHGVAKRENVAQAAG
ncbi:hypothetical protein [Pseudomonas lopnurensis]|uniref:hypothetical protein n=1 Tax=Pseudomonas lopnurensis TaxID=1477517 RepID=UPI0028A59E2C|nr:hypothetical protein [Pseudomonas lopnurensis]